MTCGACGDCAGQNGGGQPGEVRGLSETSRNELVPDNLRSTCPAASAHLSPQGISMGCDADIRTSPTANRQDDPPQTQHTSTGVQPRSVLDGEQLPAAHRAGNGRSQLSTRQERIRQWRHGSSQPKPQVIAAQMNQGADQSGGAHGRSAAMPAAVAKASLSGQCRCKSSERCCHVCGGKCIKHIFTPASPTTARRQDRLSHRTPTQSSRRSARLVADRHRARLHPCVLLLLCSRRPRSGGYARSCTSAWHQ